MVQHRRPVQHVDIKCALYNVAEQNSPADGEAAEREKDHGIERCNVLGMKLRFASQTRERAAFPASQQRDVVPAPHEGDAHAVVDSVGRRIGYQRI